MLAVIAACGGSSTGEADNGGNTGTSGALGVAGWKGTTAGRDSGTAGSPSGNATGGKPGSISEPPAGGDSSSGPGEGGAAGEPGKPGDPPKPGEPGKPGDPKPPLGMAGAPGLDENCPLEPPTDKAPCTDEMLKCNYPDIACNCDGPEDDRNWKCMQPPKPMSMCPPMPPKDASACKTQDPPAAPCHYDDPLVDCACTEDKWACATAP